MDKKSKIQSKEEQSSGYVEMIFREADMPSPEETIASGGRIKWGKKNIYPQELVGMYYDNPVHGGIINQKIKFIVAGGLNVPDQKILENQGGEYSLEEVIEIIAKDGEIFNGFAVVFRRRFTTKLNEKNEPTKETVGWYLEPLDFEQVRATEDGIYFEFSDNWASGQQSAEKQNYRKIKDITKITDDDDEGVLYIIDKPKQRLVDAEGGKTKLSKSCYPIPTYSGAIPSILAGIEMDFFTYSEVVNGYKGGTLINFANGTSNDEEKDKKRAQKVKEEATSKKKQGGLIVTYSNGQDRAATVMQINGNDTNKRYIESNKEILKKIMVAHGVISPALFGVLSENMFGSKEEMETAYILLQENYIKYRQRFISSALNWGFRKVAKIDPKIEFKKYIPPFLETTQTSEEAVLQAEKMAAQNLDDTIIEMFSKCGAEKSGFYTLKSQEFGAQNEDDFMASYQQFDSIKETRTILTMIKNEESFQAIYKAISKDGSYLATKLLELRNKGLLDGWKVTEKGNQNVATKQELKVLYSYDLKANAPDLVKGGKSREFCSRMIELNRLYTKQEIETISSAVGRDVWYYRGGWYHNPKTDVNTPSCRHIWNQKIVSNL